MGKVEGSRRLARFDGFELDLRAGELRRDGYPAIQLSEQPFRILVMLLDRSRDVVTRDEIRNVLWPNGTIVEFEHSISAAINRLRQALEDSAENPRYIETLARRGYRWKTSVQWMEFPPGAASPTEVNDSGQTRHAFSGGMIGKKVSHYRVLEVLGGGGMGVVYKAEDLRLGRRVALKFLPEEVANDPRARERFEREARAASALSHPNICTIYEVEEHEQNPFIVMELLEGETLRETISRTGSGKSPLEVEKIINLAIQISEGLDAAHRRGIIHRDIKPANIFITKDGVAKILDFGLAKLGPSAAPARNDQTVQGDDGGLLGITCEAAPLAAYDLFHSETGTAMGTAGYMSPEQVRGEKLDARTDLFSFGLVLYEMATRTRAFAGDSSAELREAILNQIPHRARELNSEIPFKLEAIIDRAIEKDREVRYQSAAAMLEDLTRLQELRRLAVQTMSAAIKRRLLLALASLVVIGIASTTVVFYLRHRAASRLTEQDTVVVADFANSTGDAIFDDTLKPALSTALRQSPFLDLLPDGKVGTTLKLMNRAFNTPLTPEIAREVCWRAGSKAYIAGTIAGLRDQYLLTLKAVNCQSGEILAQEQITAGSKEKVLDALGTAAAKMRSKLGESLASVREFDIPLSHATTQSLEALKEYSLGNKAGDEKGQDAELPHYLRAIQLDPNFAMAYLRAGRDYLNMALSARAAEYISRAYQLQDHADEHERQEIASMYFLIVTGEMDKAAQAYEKTIETYPRTPSAYSGLALLYAELGRYEEAAQINRQLIRLAPEASGGYENLALNLMSLERFDEARQTAQAESARKLDTYALHKGLYALAFVTHDAAAMAEQSAWLASNQTGIGLGVFLQSESEAYAGHLRKARELTRVLTDHLMSGDSKEAAAKIWDNAALREAMFGNAVQARQAAAEALKVAPDSQRVEIEAALALAMLGDTARAKSLAQDLDKRFPLHTQVQSLWLPTIDAQLALSEKNPTAALDRLRATSAMELGYTPTHVNISCLYAVYVRGEAYLANGEGSAAAREFQKIIDHSGIVWNCPTGALAHLGLARANVLQARTDRGVAADAARSRAYGAYQQFFDLWEHADPDIPILQQAKAEYARMKWSRPPGS